MTNQIIAQGFIGVNTIITQGYSLGAALAPIPIYTGLSRGAYVAHGKTNSREANLHSINLKFRSG
jgi:hypothetical protein